VSTDEAADAQPRRPRKRRPLWKRLLLWAGLLLTGLVGLGVAAFLVAYLAIDVPDPNADFQTETSYVYYEDGRRELGEFELQNRQPVTLAEVPQSLQDAVIAAEDDSFYDNSGIDVPGIVRAAWNNLRGESTQGASTITQQYVKIAYLSSEQSYTRKAKEAILALKIQRELSKTEILEGYLNTIYFGRGAYGVQAASQAYFGTDVDQLNIAQSALLATVLNEPGNLDPAEGRGLNEEALDRYRYVLGRMVELDMLDQTRADRLSQGLPRTPVQPQEDRFGGPEGYLLAMIQDELQAEGFTAEEINGGGLEITTTFSRDDMRAVKSAVRAEQPPGLDELHVAVASVEPGTGAVRALYGGPDYLGDGSDAQVNWATAAAQPGSTFKVFALLAALREGYGLGAIFDGSSPYTLPGTGEAIENQGDSGGVSYGAVTLLTATVNSVNTAYVDLTLALGEGMEGPQRVLDAAELAGIPPEVLRDVDPVPVVPLGFAPVPPVDMANAYATFAAGGERADWFTVEKVVDSDGRTRYTHDPDPEQVMSPGIAADITYALQQVVTSGTGLTASALTCPAAGKTGTATSDDSAVSSSWFVGFSPKLSTAVMYVRGDGNDELLGYLPTYFGGAYPAQTWTAAMEGELAGTDCGEFPPPAYVGGPPPTTATEPPSTTSPPTAGTTQPPTTTRPPPTTTDPPPTTTEPPTTDPATTEPTRTNQSPPTAQSPATTRPPGDPDPPDPDG